MAFPPTSLFKCHFFFFLLFPLAPFPSHAPPVCHPAFPWVTQIQETFFPTEKSLAVTLPALREVVLHWGQHLQLSHRCWLWLASRPTNNPPSTWWHQATVMDGCLCNPDPPKALSVLPFLSLVPRTAPVPPAQMASLCTKFSRRRGLPEARAFYPETATRAGLIRKSRKCPFRGQAQQHCI